LLKSGEDDVLTTSVKNRFLLTIEYFRVRGGTGENAGELVLYNTVTSFVEEIPEGFSPGVPKSTVVGDEIVTETYTSTVEVTEKPKEDIVGGIGNFYRVPGYPFLGKFMHIHVNLDFISTTLENNIDDKGNVSVYKFLQQLMKGIQQAIGQINDFDIVYDEVNNYYVIRDLNILPGAETLLDREIEITRFNVNILKNNFGSFVLDTAIKSTLNNSFASTIAIGAQVNGNKIGENSTALSKLNNGYTDRLIKNRSSIPDDDNNESAGKSKKPEDVYRDNLITFTDFINKINLGTVTSDDISNNSQAVIDILKYELGYYTEQGNIPGAGFIPIDLQLTMDGLSGPRIYEVYNINEDLLPDSYKNNIQFITIGVNHKIDGNGWTTTLNSLSGPRRDNLKPIVNIPTEEPPKTSEPVTTTPPPTPTPITEDQIVYLTNTIRGVQYYGANRSGGARRHAGVDIDITGPDAKMISFIGGEVINISEQRNREGQLIGYGKYVDIQNRSLGVVERIAEAKNINVSIGQTVSKGQVVATGESKTGVIHYEIRKIEDYQKNKFGYDFSTDPIEYLVSKGIVTIKPSPLGYNKTEIIFKT
jgi:murein DD-endopeptidase MepM/ murein hydrolase activator NlpD